MKIFISLILRFLPCAGFDATNMNRVQLGTMTTWYYKSAEAIATVEASGYFNNYAAQFCLGDVIVVSGVTNGLINTLGVTSADGAAVVTTLVAIT